MIQVRVPKIQKRNLTRLKSQKFPIKITNRVDNFLGHKIEEVKIKNNQN